LRQDLDFLKTCGNRNATVRKGLLNNFWIRTGTEEDWIIC